MRSSFMTWSPEGFVSISGKIDHTFSPLLLEVPAKDFRPSYLHDKNFVLTLDLSQVTGFNSKGILSWHTWLKGIKAQIHLVRCSAWAFIQFCMTPTLFGENCVLVSFFANYTCSVCKREGLELLDVSGDLVLDKANSVLLTRILDCPFCRKFGTFAFDPSVSEEAVHKLLSEQAERVKTCQV